MKRAGGWRQVAGAMSVFVAAHVAAGAARGENQGAALYQRYCASCHGIEGRGDGPVAAALSPPPPDLTKLQSTEGELVKQIDGRRTARAHGTAAMPVWGEVFEQSSVVERGNFLPTLGRTMALTEYVMRLRRATPVPSATP